MLSLEKVHMGLFVDLQFVKYRQSHAYSGPDAHHVTVSYFKRQPLSEAANREKIGALTLSCHEWKNNHIYHEVFH